MISTQDTIAASQEQAEVAWTIGSALSSLFGVLDGIYVNGVLNLITVGAIIGGFFWADKRLRKAEAQTNRVVQLWEELEQDTRETATALSSLRLVLSDAIQEAEKARTGVEDALRTKFEKSTLECRSALDALRKQSFGSVEVKSPWFRIATRAGVHLSSCGCLTLMSIPLLVSVGITLGEASLGEEGSPFGSAVIAALLAFMFCFAIFSNLYENWFSEASKTSEQRQLQGIQDNRKAAYWKEGTRQAVEYSIPLHVWELDVLQPLTQAWRESDPSSARFLKVCERSFHLALAKKLSSPDGS